MLAFRDYAPSVRRALAPGISQDMRAARQAGLSLPRWRAVLEARLDLLPSLAPLRGGLVLDLGANVGDWTAAVLRAEPTATVVAAEPADAPRAQLTSRFAADARVTIDPRAVADSAGERDFHITTHSHNASLHPPKEGMDALYGHGWAVAGVTAVTTVTVDELAQGRDVAVLKIDVQGAEREALAGARSTLTSTSAVLLEVTFVTHYTDDATFPWLHSHMQAIGFELAGLSPPFMSRRNTALWCDACYVPVPHAPPTRPGG